MLRPPNHRADQHTDCPVAIAGRNAPVTAPSSETPVYFGEVLVTWNTGNKDAAVKQFLQMPWQASSVFDGIPVLMMSEQPFTALPEAQRGAVGQQAQQL